MRKAFAHDALVELDGHGDIRAPGAAITLALCGSWEHEPPCPLAPHHTEARRCPEGLALHVLFAAEPEDEVEIRDRIRTALSWSALQAPDGVTTRWHLLSAQPGTVADAEASHVERLAAG